MPPQNISTEFKYKKEFSIEERKQQVDKQLKNYPKHVFVVCEPDQILTKNQDLKVRRKFYIQETKQIIDLIQSLKSKDELKVTKEEALYLYSDQGKLIDQFKTLAEIKQSYVSEDGIVYIKYSKQETFG